MKICFIGGGNMANALIGGLIRRGHAASDIHVVEPYQAAAERLRAQFGVSVSAAPDAHIGAAQVLVLAVKPQQMHAAVAPLSGLLSHQVVVSIAAGTRVACLVDWLGGYRRIVRAMPNTPALIGEGITGLFADAALSAAERAAAESVLAAAGPHWSAIWNANVSFAASCSVSVPSSGSNRATGALAR